MSSVPAGKIKGGLGAPLGLRANVPNFRDWLATTAAIVGWELRSALRRPTSYVLLLATTLVAGWNFSLLVTLLSRGQVVPLRAADDPLAQFLGPNVFLVFSLMLVVPVVTMGLVADERRRGLWEMLLTAPVQPVQALIGKLVAAWSQIVAATLPWLFYLLVLRYASGLEFDLGPVIGGCLGVAMLSLTLAAIGLLCSTICRAPFAAATSTAAAMIVLLLHSLLPRALAYWRLSEIWIERAGWVASWEHLAQFSRGLVDGRIVSGHVSFALLLLWLSVQASSQRD